MIGIRKIGIGLNMVKGGDLFSAEYQAVYNSLTTKPSAAIAAAQNTMVAALVADGVWAKLDVFYCYAQTTNGGGEALKNWVNPGTFDATAFNAPAFVSLEGFTGANTKYIDCNWNPNSDSVNYAQNDASLGCYIRTNVAEDGYDFGVFIGGFKSQIISRRAGGTESLVWLNTGTEGNPLNNDSRGMFILNRVLSTHQDFYKNKVRILNGAQASTGIPDGDMYMLALNVGGAGAFCTRQLSLFFAGGGFTQGDVDNITDRFEAYMDSNGKGVIP